MRLTITQPESDVRMEPTVEVTLSRRNLLSLLTKLDRALSHKTLLTFQEGVGLLVVRAEEDTEHYDGRTPGMMDPQTEKDIVLSPFIKAVAEAAQKLADRAAREEQRERNRQLIDDGRGVSSRDPWPNRD